MPKFNYRADLCQKFYPALMLLQRRWYFVAHRRSVFGAGCLWRGGGLCCLYLLRAVLAAGSACQEAQNKKQLIKITFHGIHI